MILQPDEYRSRQLKYAPLEKVGVSALQQCGVFNPELKFISATDIILSIELIIPVMISTTINIPT